MLKYFMLCTLVFGMMTGTAGNPEDFNGTRLKNKIVPLGSQVYRLLDHYEALGYLPFLPQTRPYTKIYILKTLTHLENDIRIPGKGKEEIQRYIRELNRETNGVQFAKTAAGNNFAVVGFGADTYIRQGAGPNGSTSYSLTALPYLSGDLGHHLSFSASMGPSIEQLTPDLFYGSYTKDGRVVFPYLSTGFSWLPYRFNYESLYFHVGISDKKIGKKEISGEISVGMVYYTEVNGSLFDGALQVSLNNQRRAWGHDRENLVLSITARRFPGFEVKLEPVKWFRYSMLTGSLFHFSGNSADYLKGIYGYDVGASLKMLSQHMLEITPSKWLQISATAGCTWVKRMEPAYLLPFAFPHFSELNVGDYDNHTMGLDFAFRIPGLGKAWFSVFNDEFSFTEKGNLLRKPRNRYAWQAGIRSAALSQVLPTTTATLKYTRLTPFVYTHYPETRLTAVSSRPVDLTYSHDGFNLGFYLPPNSGELNLTLVNRLIPDLVLSLENRLIIHGTNDLASENPYRIYGDIYRYQFPDSNGSVEDYPLTNFTKDGIYDMTISSELHFDLKIRKSSLLNYFRVTGSAGISYIQWITNQSYVMAPAGRIFSSGSIGIIVDI